jgi:hypothetical protein
MTAAPVPAATAVYPGVPVSASGQGVLSLPVCPLAAGNLLVLVFGAGGGGKVSALSTGVSGGGVTQWQRATGWLDTGDWQLAEVWWGMVAVPGRSAVTVANAGAAADWCRLWAVEASASGAAPAWSVTGSSAVTAAGPSGSGSAVTYPAALADGPGLYVGAATTSYGTLSAGTTPGVSWATVDSHLQAAWGAVAGGVAPVSSSSDPGERWNTVAVLVTAASTGVPLAAAGGAMEAGVAGQPYDGVLTASGGTPPYSWALAGLPAGLSLSLPGAVTGVPSGAGTSPFTVTVTDSAGATVTTAAGITVTAAPAVLYTGNYPPDAHATYTASGPDPLLSLAGVTRAPYMDVNVWGPVPLETIKSTVQSVRNWSVAVNVSNPGGGVTCFPNTGAFPITAAWGAWGHFTSGWDEQMDGNPAIIASACYDNWFDNTRVGPTGAAVSEVMLHFDFRNRGAGPWVAQNVKFGGYTVDGTVIPVTYWSLAASGGTCWWNLVDGNGGITSLPAGAVDMLAMLQWLAKAGYLDPACNMTGFSVGYEICHTGGDIADFTYNDLWWSGGP